MESNIEIYIQVIIDQFSSLVTQAEKVIFPVSRDGVFAPRGKANWSSIRRIIYELACPYTFLDEKWGGWQIAILIVWLILSISCLSLTQRIALNQKIASDWSHIVLLVFIVLFSSFSYGSWIEFFIDPRYKFTIKLLVLFLFLPFLFSLESYPVSNSGPVIVSLIRTPRLFAGLIIPVFSFFYMIFVHIVILGFWIYEVMLKWIVAFHKPLPFQYLRNLIQQEIPPNGAQLSAWKITELDQANLSTIRKWAIANRDATEKRTIPVLVIFAVLGFFSSTQYFSVLIDKFLALVAPLSQGLSSPFSFTRISAVIVSTTVVAIFMIIYGRLFKNLAVQNLIIETCIVVEHAKSKEISKAQPDRVSIKSIILTWIDRFLNH
jgi:hypothetical protein